MIWVQCHHSVVTQEVVCSPCKEAEGRGGGGACRVPDLHGRDWSLHPVADLQFHIHLFINSNHNLSLTLKE